MKRLLIALACLTLSFPCLAQSADEPASKDDVILYLRTMHSHDLMQKTIAVQFQSMQELLHDQLLKEKGTVPADFDSRMKKMMDELAKDMPVDEITEAMIPAYQAHFTHADIEAMNTFYASPVGQKVLEQLPAVMREGMQAAMPLLSKYLSDWQERMKHEFEPTEKSAPAKAGETPRAQN
jgi:hypothetical protein